ncbi:hypothetical protein C0J52_04207 [Blattella germanica]|nr:hypothetical protein C0J52_04207 [Blattella germanica]
MDQFNLNVYVEQVNHEATGKWEENEEQALSNVIDPNTEFKAKESSGTSVTPSNSYGLTNEPIKSHILKKRSTSEDLIRRHSDCLNRELEGYKSRRKKSLPDSSLVAKVHAYASTHLPTQAEEDMDDPEARADFDSQRKLVKYPPDRITVVTEKCSYLTRPPSRTKALDSLRTHGGCDSPLDRASSRESLSTASVASERIHQGRGSVISNRSEMSCRLDRSMTTADQLAWEFRRARDRLDTASNLSGCSSHFELDSNYSERAETMSTISDVSGYEEEMFRIKRLLLLDDSSTPTPPPGAKHNEAAITLKSEAAKENVEIQIHRLSVQLQNALADKERSNLEWQEKLQEALRQKAHLEGRLESIQAEAQVHNAALEQELKTKWESDRKMALQEMERLTLEINNLRHLVREAQNKNEDLAEQLELKDSEIRRRKGEATTAEEANEKLRIELQELRVESESRDGAVQGLKAKISDQHVEFQSLLQAKLKAENNLAGLRNEVESARKSGHWYRDQLHACQAAKVKVQQELMTSQANAVSQGHLIEKLKVDVANMQQLVEETRHRAVREKDTLMRKLEVIQADMLEREATIFSQVRNDSTTETINTIASKLKKMEEEKRNLSDTVLQEMKDEIASLRNEVLGKETALEAAGAENARLMSRLAALQKTMNDKEVNVQLLENKCKNIEVAHNHLAENLRSKDRCLLDLKNEKVAVEVALAAAEREKTEVDAATDKLREDFSRMTLSYQAMKSELREKDKYGRSLKEDVAELQKEKHSLLQRIGEFGRVESELEVLRGRMSQTQVLEERVQQLLKSNRELNSKVGELNEAHSYAKAQMSKLEETIAVREEQLLNQTKNIEVHAEELKKREQLLVDARNEKTSLEEKVNKLNAKVEELLDEKKRAMLEVDSLKKRAARANDAMEQFNLLCRKSEEEKNELEKKMKQLLEKSNGSVFISTSNGHVQANLCNLLDSIQKVESKITLLLSDEIVNEKNQEDRGVAEFESAIVNLDNYLTKALKWKNDLSEMKEVSDQKPSSQIGHGTQTDRISMGSTGTQTLDGDFMKYKERADALSKEVNRLKASLKLSEIEHREKHRRYETNVRTLLKKVKEHMRGRKAAERIVEELRAQADPVRSKSEIEELKLQLQSSQAQYEEQRRLVEKNQEAMLELEKERGKLVQNWQQQKFAPAQEKTSREFDQKSHELRISEVQTRLSDLEEQIHKQHLINKDLRKEIFTERCETSQLRKQVSSLQMGLDTANDMLDAKKTELVRTESLCTSLRTDLALVKKQLEEERRSHDDTKLQAERLQASLEEVTAKDPMLADQIKTLSYHLHQKSQEAAGLHEDLRLSEERRSATESGLQRNLSALQEELTGLRTELDSVRTDKFALQTQAAELRTALHSSIEQNKVLRLKLEAYGCEIKDKLPDLTSSLPLPPSKYDESRIAELLQQSTILPHNKPLNNLQCCLDSLKEEMAVLQRQIAAKTSRDGDGSGEVI